MLAMELAVQIEDELNKEANIIGDAGRWMKKGYKNKKLRGSETHQMIQDSNRKKSLLESATKRHQDEVDLLKSKGKSHGEAYSKWEASKRELDRETKHGKGLSRVGAGGGNVFTAIRGDYRQTKDRLSKAKKYVFGGSGGRRAAKAEAAASPKAVPTYMDKAKEFGTKHKKPLLIGGGVVGAGAVGSSLIGGSKKDDY